MNRTTRLGTNRELYIHNDDGYKKNDINMVLTKLGQMALILLNYRYSPTGHIGVNASIRPHSTGTPTDIVVPYDSSKARLGSMYYCI